MSEPISQYMIDCFHWEAIKQPAQSSVFFNYDFYDGKYIKGKVLNNRPIDSWTFLNKESILQEQIIFIK